MHIESPACLAIAFALSLAIIFLSRGKSSLIQFLALACLVAAAGEPALLVPRPRSIVVMVDLSPSTRGADFRDSSSLTRRIRELIGDHPYHLLSFAANNHPLDLSEPMTEIFCDQTRFAPPPADDILLFSDARFDLPDHSAPTFIALDGGLENIADARIDSASIVNGSLHATFTNTGNPRTAAIPDSAIEVPPGPFSFTRAVDPQTRSVQIRLNPQDLWPENDALLAIAPPPEKGEKWWVGDNAPGAGWRTFLPADIPTDPIDYLAPAVIVLNNISADAISAQCMDRLSQYTLDLGGSLLILGGDHAFLPGNYLGSELENLSPLSSAPPAPSRRWILLADSSGSMAGDRFTKACEAIAHLIPHLPHADSLQIGQFSDTVRWWSTGKSVAESLRENLPPADAMAHGPTNLQSSLDQIARQIDPALPTTLLLLSDCDAKIDDPAGLSQEFSARKVQLDVLALGQGQGITAINFIANQTGGQVVNQLDPAHWSADATKLGQTAMGEQITHTSATLKLDGIGTFDISQWNSTWPKSGATLLTHGDARAATWQSGLGTVTAAAFWPGTYGAEQLARIYSRKPRDPRYSVSWLFGAQPDVSISAVSNGHFMNELKLNLNVDLQSQSIPQTAPGRYEITFPSPAETRIAMITLDGQIIARAAIAPQYPPEFSALGNNHANMRKLADTSGGAVIAPNDHQPIQFKSPLRTIDLTSWLAACGACLLAMTLFMRNGVSLAKFRRAH